MKKQALRSIVGTLVHFSLPLIMSGVLQQLYNWADAFVVGNAEGELSLAAIGAATTPVSLFVTGITGFALGLSVLAARYYGMGERWKLARLAFTFSALLGGVFVVIAAANTLLSNAFMQWLHTPTDVTSGASDYIAVVAVGFPFLAVYNVCTAVLRGLGDSRAAFFSILLSAVVNVGLDLLLVACWRFGVLGAAVATIVSQAAMTIFIVVYAMKKYPWLREHAREKSSREGVLRDGLSFGVPSMLQACINSLGGLVLQDFMNRFGTQTVTAITTAYRIDTLVLLPVTNLSTGISTMAAYNHAMGNKEGVRQIHIAGVTLTAAVSLLLAAAVVPTGGRLIALFGAGSAAVEIGSGFFLRIACFYPVYGLSMVYRGLLEGRGRMFYSGAIGVAALGIRIAASYALVDRFGNMSIAYAEMLSWVTRLVMYGLAWRRCVAEKGGGLDWLFGEKLRKASMRGDSSVN